LGAKYVCEDELTLNHYQSSLLEIASKNNPSLEKMPSWERRKTCRVLKGYAHARYWFSAH